MATEKEMADFMAQKEANRRKCQAELAGWLEKIWILQDKLGRPLEPKELEALKKEHGVLYTMEEPGPVNLFDPFNPPYVQ